jgi:hypothetical protein
MWVYKMPYVVVLSLRLSDFQHTNCWIDLLQFMKNFNYKLVTQVRLPSSPMMPLTVNHMHKTDHSKISTTKKISEILYAALWFTSLHVATCY